MKTSNPRHPNSIVIISFRHRYAIKISLFLFSYMLVWILPCILHFSLWMSRTNGSSPMSLEDSSNLWRTRVTWINGSSVVVQNGSMNANGTFSFSPDMSFSSNTTTVPPYSSAELSYSPLTYLENTTLWVDAAIVPLRGVVHFFCYFALSFWHVWKEARWERMMDSPASKSFS